ncbi:MAG TPA: cysteine--tRNA ligase [Dehalococcoidia bacterium]|nr:cysteine--tRNA ligase [Dehalococcoidia bacterium]
MNIFDTLDNKRKSINLSEKKKIKIYVCGITPYSESHIGHAMSAVIFDTLRKYLLANQQNVTYVQNFTDIDDKLIKAAKENNSDIKTISTKFIDKHLSALNKLNVLKPDYSPKATEEIKEMINMIGVLISKGIAYEINGNCYFRVEKFKTYGKLSKRNFDEMLAGARIEIDERKENPMDFALWKTKKGNEPGWESPWGEGRPGWHIECSAMSMKYLGQNIDIHGGGRDLIFPHHENEIAQSEAFTNSAPFSNIWMHNGLINLKSEKMSKSLGNIITIDHLLNQFSAAAIRMFFISSNYKNPLEYNTDLIAANERAIMRLKNTSQLKSSANIDHLNTSTFIKNFHDAMQNDLNTSMALGAIFELSKAINQAKIQNLNITYAQGDLINLLNILGININEERINDKKGTFDKIDEKWIKSQIELRNKYRKLKNFSDADDIRKELLSKGISLLDSRNGTEWTIQ